MVLREQERQNEKGRGREREGERQKGREREGERQKGREREHMNVSRSVKSDVSLCFVDLCRGLPDIQLKHQADLLVSTKYPLQKTLSL